MIVSVSEVNYVFKLKQYYHYSCFLFHKETYQIKLKYARLER